MKKLKIVIGKKHIEQMLTDDWEGNKEIFVPEPEDECSKPFNTPKY